MTTATETTVKRILARHDKGQPVKEISRALDVSSGFIYRVLRDLRPNRKRKPREKTSDVPRMIAGLAKQGIKPARVAVVLGVTRAYVYRHWPEGPRS